MPKVVGKKAKSLKRVIETDRKRGYSGFHSLDFWNMCSNIESTTPCSVDLKCLLRSGRQCPILANSGVPSAGHFKALLGQQLLTGAT